MQNQYIFYGTNSNGDDPVIRSSFKVDKNKYLGSKTKSFDSLGGAKAPHENNISYAVTNLNPNNKANSFQNVIANSSGKDPKSGIKMKTNQNGDYVRGSINGQALTDDSGEGSQTWVDVRGTNNKFGYSDNLVFADQEGDKLISIGEINNLAADDGIVDDNLHQEKNNYFSNKPQNEVDEKKYLMEKEFLSKLEEDLQKEELNKTNFNTHDTIQNSHFENDDQIIITKDNFQTKPPVIDNTNIRTRGVHNVPVVKNDHVKNIEALKRLISTSNSDFPVPSNSIKKNYLNDKYVLDHSSEIKFANKSEDHQTYMSNHNANTYIPKGYGSYSDCKNIKIPYYCN